MFPLYFDPLNLLAQSEMATSTAASGPLLVDPGLSCVSPGLLHLDVLSAMLVDRSNLFVDTGPGNVSLLPTPSLPKLSLISPTVMSRPHPYHAHGHHVYRATDSFVTHRACPSSSMEPLMGTSRGYKHRHQVKVSTLE